MTTMTTELLGGRGGARELHYEVILITPSMAAQWLSLSMGNRRIKKGKLEQMGDVLSRAGEKNASDLSAAISMCWAFEHGVPMQAGAGPAHDEALIWLEQNARVRQSVQVGKATSARIGLSRTALSVAHYKTSQVALEDAELFYWQLREGTDLVTGSPILALRRWAENTRSKRDRPKAPVQLAHVLKALNAWREGRQIINLQWRSGGASAEEFPKIWIPA